MSKSWHSNWYKRITDVESENGRPIDIVSLELACRHGVSLSWPTIAARVSPLGHSLAYGDNGRK